MSAKDLRTPLTRGISGSGSDWLLPLPEKNFCRASWIHAHLLPTRAETGNSRGFLEEPTVIGDGITIFGKLRSKGNIILHGTIQADVYCSSLIISETGKLIGRIVADTVSVHGRVAGAIYAKNVELFANSNVQADIFHHEIGIERGSRYEGWLKQVNDPISMGKAAVNGSEPSRLLRKGRSKPRISVRASRSG